MSNLFQMMGHWWTYHNRIPSPAVRQFVRRVKRGIWSMLYRTCEAEIQQNYGEWLLMGWLVAMALIVDIMAKSSAISWFQEDGSWIGWQSAILPFIWRAIMASLPVLIFGERGAWDARLRYSRGNLQILWRDRRQKISFMASVWWELYRDDPLVSSFGVLSSYLDSKRSFSIASPMPGGAGWSSLVWWLGVLRIINQAHAIDVLLERLEVSVRTPLLLAMQDWYPNVGILWGWGCHGKVGRKPWLWQTL